eukprot:gene11028-12278_t
MSGMAGKDAKANGLRSVGKGEVRFKSIDKPARQAKARRGEVAENLCGKKASDEVRLSSVLYTTFKPLFSSQALAQQRCAAVRCEHYHFNCSAEDIEKSLFTNTKSLFMQLQTYKKSSSPK